MNRFYTAMLTALFLLLSPGLSRGEDYALWNDAAYDFTAVRTIYIDEMDTSHAAIHSPAKVQRIKEDFAAKAADEKWKQTTFITAPITPPVIEETADTETLPADTSAQHATVERTNVSTADPGEGIAETEAQITPPLPDAQPLTDLPKEGDRISVPEAAKTANADLYVKGDILAYGVGTGLIPAHTEWNSYPVHDVYYDRDGHAHWFTRYISYPVYMPDQYVPVASVSVRFTVVDVKTGTVVSLSEDTRGRGSSNDTRGVYKRIIDRFFKNLKKQVRP